MGSLKPPLPLWGASAALPPDSGTLFSLILETWTHFDPSVPSSEPYYSKKHIKSTFCPLPLISVLFSLLCIICFYCKVTLRALEDAFK